MPPIPIDPSAGARRLVELDADGPELSRFSWFEGAERRRGLLWRHPEGPRAFLDRCPHWAVALTHLHDGVLRGDRLRCSVHGAEFDPDGVCVAGPCEGSRLHPLLVATSGARLTVSMPAGTVQQIGRGA